MMHHREGYLNLTLVFILLMAVAGISPTHGRAQTEKGVTTVHILGSSGIRGDDLQAGREAAINGSLIAAVSQVLMGMLPQETLTSHFQVINETVFSRTDQFIRDFKVLAESTHAGTYRVMVQASVSKDRLAKVLKRSGLGAEKRQALRVLLCVAEKGITDLNYRYWWGGQDLAEPAPAVTALGQQLLEGGLRLVAERPDLASGGLSPELAGPQAVALARQLEADIVVSGLAAAEEAPNTMGSSIRSFRGFVDLKVYRAIDGQQIGQIRQSALSAGSDAYADSRQALRNAAQQAAEEVIRQIAAAGVDRDTGTGLVELVVEGTGGNIANFVKLRGALVTMSGVNNVQLKEMMADTAVLLVEYQGRARALADALLRQGFDTFGINISEVGLNRVRLKLVAP